MEKNERSNRAGKRVSMQVSADVDRRLNDIAGSLGVTRTEVFRRALALLSFVLEAEGNGRRLCFTDENERTELLKLL